VKTPGKPLSRCSFLPQDGHWIAGRREWDALANHTGKEYGWDGCLIPFLVFISTFAALDRVVFLNTHSARTWYFLEAGDGEGHYYFSDQRRVMGTTWSDGDYSNEGISYFPLHNGSLYCILFLPVSIPLAALDW